MTITGTNDAAVITGTATVDLTETERGAEHGRHADDRPTWTARATFVAQTNAAGTYGTFTIDAAGAWTYTMNTAHDEFVAGTTLHRQRSRW